MRKLLSLSLAGALLAVAASVASAAEIKAKGRFDFGFGLYDGTNFTKHSNEERFEARQRLRTQVDYIASESLKGVFQIEIGTTDWGNGGGATWGDPAVGRGAGGAMGADGVSVEVKHMYIDWLVPQTDLQVRMGIQPFALPTAVNRGDYQSGNYVVDDDMAGLLLSYNFSENVGVNLGWFRPWDGASAEQTGSGRYDNPRFGEKDEIDIFTLTLPIEVADTFSFTPYGVFANVGSNLGDNLWYETIIGYYGTANTWLTGNGAFGDNGTAWWAGLAFDLSYFDPFIAALDFTYGSYSADNVAPYSGFANYLNANGTNAPNDPDRSGWAVVAKLGYKLDYFTPNIIGWYGSGADLDGGDGYDGLLPSLSPFWGMTSFGYMAAGALSREAQIGASPAGTWGVAAGLDDIRFIDNLTTYFRLAYYSGTNDVENYNRAAKASGSLDAFRQFEMLDKSDWAFEVNLDNVINIYDNLDMYVEVAYLHVDVDQAGSDFDEDAWKGFVGFKYSF